jgi:hypothetical protein
MQDARVYLGLVRERGKKGLPLTRVYRQLYNRDLYLIAYGKIYRNAGATTQGTTEETVDAMSLVLRSLNAITKEATVMAMILGRSSPDPRLGTPVELRGGHPGGLLDLSGIGKTLACERITAKQAPPALLQIEPARSCRNEHVMDARMLRQPGARLQTRVTAEIVADDEQVSARIVGLDVGEQSNIALGIA